MEYLEQSGDVESTNAGNMTSGEPASSSGRNPDLADRVLTAYADQYKDLVDVWKTLETKAQGAVAIAGIFLAAAFNYSRDLSSRGGVAERILFACAVVALCLAVGCAVLALLVEKVHYGPSGELVDREVRRLEALTPAAAVYELRKTLYDLAGVYGDAIRSLEVGIHRKGKWLRRAQAALAVGAGLVTSAAVWTLFRLIRAMSRCQYDSCLQPARPLSHYCVQHRLSGPSGPRTAGMEASTSFSAVLKTTASIAAANPPVGLGMAATRSFLDPYFRGKVFPAFRSDDPREVVLGALMEGTTTWLSRSSTLPHRDLSSIYEDVSAQFSSFRDRKAELLDPWFRGQSGLWLPQIESSFQTTRAIVTATVLTVAASPPFGLGVQRTLSFLVRELARRSSRLVSEYATPEEFLLAQLIDAARAVSPGPDLLAANARVGLFAEAIGRLYLEAAWQGEIGEDG